MAYTPGPYVRFLDDDKNTGSTGGFGNYGSSLSLSIPKYQPKTYDNYVDKENLNFLQNALSNNRYKPKQYNDWQYIANQQVANPDYSGLNRQAYQSRDTALNRLSSNYNDSKTKLQNSYADSKANLQTGQTNQTNAAIKRALAGGLGAGGAGPGLADYRTDTIKDSFKPSFDRLDRDNKVNMQILSRGYNEGMDDVYSKYRDALANINAQKEDRGLRVAAEATRLMQADTQGFRNWQNALADTLQKYSSDQSDLAYKQGQDAYKRQQDEFANNLALQKFAWDKERSMLPYQMPTANSLLSAQNNPGGFSPYQQYQMQNRQVTQDFISQMLMAPNANQFLDEHIADAAESGVDLGLVYQVLDRK